MLTTKQQIVKRSFDLTFSVLGLITFGWLIGLGAILSRIDTGQSGIFRQTRVGKNGVRFQIFKLRTMRVLPGVETNVTTDLDPRITSLGSLLRKSKMDELPQLYNVFRGDMSFVGPRPDVPELVAAATLSAREVFQVRPGITGPASLRYRDEESLLSTVPDPESYNRDVIFADKIHINRQYVRNYSFATDLKYLWQTLSGTGERAELPENLEWEQRERKSA